MLLFWFLGYAGCMLLLWLSGAGKLGTTRGTVAIDANTATFERLRGSEGASGTRAITVSRPACPVADAPRSAGCGSGGGVRPFGLSSCHISPLISETPAQSFAGKSYVMLADGPGSLVCSAGDTVRRLPQHKRKRPLIPPLGSAFVVGGKMVTHLAPCGSVGRTAHTSGFYPPQSVTATRRRTRR